MESHTKHPAIQVIVNEMSNVVNDKEYLHKGFGTKYRGEQEGMRNAGKI
jgi:hypothetical protein